MCVFVCLYFEPVSRSKDDVWSGIKIGSVLCLCYPSLISLTVSVDVKHHVYLCLCTPVSPSVMTWGFMSSDVGLILGTAPPECA